MNGIFEMETGKPFRVMNYILNCHVCGQSFTPVDVAIVPTNYKCYYNDSYQRLCLMYIFPQQRVKICEHTSPMMIRWGTTWFHETGDIPKNMYRIVDCLEIDQEKIDALNEATEIYTAYMKDRKNV